MSHADSCPPALHAYVICWTGMEDAAQRIAAALAPAADSVTVIYSNEQNTLASGEGSWIQVPNEWYYGRKFRECLRLHSDGIMLQIQSDAYSDNWPDIIHRCRDAHSNYANIGIWSPNVDYTPWRTEIVLTGVMDQDGLKLVAINDGIVWSLTKPVVQRMKELDYEINNLGWGLDWFAASHARTKGLMVVRDHTITVRHPSETNYSRELASRQMKAFLLQMTHQESEQYDLLNSFVGQRMQTPIAPSAVKSEEGTQASVRPLAGTSISLMDWPQRRAGEICERLRQLADRGSINYSFRSGIPSTIYRYFSDGQDAELDFWSPEPFRYVPAQDYTVTPDVVIVTGHSNDLQRELWEMREEMGADPIIITWLWDNHTAYINNKSVALAADLVMPCHSDSVDYLFNPVSVVSSHVPLCCAQWTRAEAESLFSENCYSERKSKLLVNYVEYAYAAERNEVIQQIRESIPEADVLLMPSSDRSRYFGVSPTVRFKEWAGYKSTIILPVTQDLSTRFFDALITGLVPIVPRLISDLDRTIATDELDALGVVRINSYDIEEIRWATRDALLRFDQMGPDGILARHRFALERHMLINRITQILHTVHLYVEGRHSVTFGDGPFGVALYQQNIPAL